MDNIIYQGSNAPITLSSDVPPQNMIDLKASIYDSNGKQVAKFNSTDIGNAGGIITIPMSQAFTAALPAGKIKLLLKWLRPDGITDFADEIVYIVKAREDKDVMLRG